MQESAIVVVEVEQNQYKSHIQDKHESSFECIAKFVGMHKPMPLEFGKIDKDT